MLYTLKMTLSGSESLPGHPRSLVLRIVGFTHSACHYYSQLLTTTQIGLATTLVMRSRDVLYSHVSTKFAQNPHFAYVCTCMYKTHGN